MRVIDPHLREAGAQRLDVGPHQRPVFLAERLGNDRHLLARFQILERRRVGEAELELGGIQDVEHDDVVAAKPQRRHRLEHGVGVLVEIGDQHQDAPAAEVLRQLVERRLEAARRARLQPVHDVQHRVHVLGRRRHELDHVVVEGGEADAITLVVHQVGQAGGDDARVVELGDAAAAVVHRLRHVQQHREVHVRLGLVLLDVEPVGARPHAPVHPADIVAGHVAAVLGKVHRGAEVRRLVQAVDEAVDDRASTRVPGSRCVRAPPGP